MVSLLGAITAIYLKYSLLFALFPIFCGVVMLIRVRGWRGSLPWLAILTVISAVTAGYLIWGYGALELQNQEAQGFRESGLRNMFDPERNWVNLRVALEMSPDFSLFLISLFMGGGLWRVARDHDLPRIQLNWLWIFIPYVVGNMLLTSSVVFASLERGGYGRIRFMFPAVLALSVIWALAVLQFLIVVQRQSDSRWMPPFIVIALTAVVLVPALQENMALIRNYARPDSTYLLWQYTDTSLPPEGNFLTARGSRTHKTWNRPYSGYDGDTGFAWVHDDQPEQGTPQDAWEAGIAYFVMTESDRAFIYNSREVTEWIDELWRLKVIKGGTPDVAGDTTTVFRILPPELQTDVVFGGEIALVGYDLSAAKISAEDTLTFRPYWQAIKTPAANYSMFVHIYPADVPTNIVMQVDGTPVHERRLPLTWNDPDERLVGRDVVFTVPADIEPGDYTLAVGLL